MHKFIVCSNLRSSIILGIDFIISNGLALLPLTKHLFWQDGHPARARQRLRLAPFEAKMLEVETDMLVLGDIDMLFEPTCPFLLDGVVRRGSQFIIPVCNDSNETLEIERGAEIGSLGYCVEASEAQVASEVAKRSPSSAEEEVVRIDLRKVPAEVRPR